MISPNLLSKWKENSVLAHLALGALIALCVPSTVAAEGLSINEVYRSIPHRQTTYRARVSLISSKGAVLLENLFGIVDRAIVARVETLQWFTSGGRQGRPISHYQQTLSGLLAELEGLDPPQALTPAMGLIAAALRDQAAYFRAWKTATDRGEPFPYSFSRGEKLHPLVRSSSGKLVRAYSLLMRAYPGESAHNRQAFFDHLCALDFI